MIQELAPNFWLPTTVTPLPGETTAEMCEIRKQPPLRAALILSRLESSDRPEIYDAHPVKGRIILILQQEKHEKYQTLQTLQDSDLLNYEHLLRVKFYKIIQQV